MRSQDMTIDARLADRYEKSEAMSIILYLRDANGAIVGSLVAMTLGLTALTQTIWFLHPELNQNSLVFLLNAVETEAARRGCTQIFIEKLPEDQELCCMGIGYRIVNGVIYAPSDRSPSFLTKSLRNLATSLV